MTVSTTIHFFSFGWRVATQQHKVRVAGFGDAEQCVDLMGNMAVLLGHCLNVTFNSAARREHGPFRTI